MHAKGWITLRMFLNRFHPGFNENLLKPLPEEEIKGISNQQTSERSIEIATIQPEEMIKNVHYSWLVPALERLPEQLLGPTVASLSALQQRSILKKLNLKELSRPKKLVRTYLLNNLYEAIKQPEILPLAFLPATSLSCLATYSKEQIVELANFLGIYDITEEVRAIIEKEKLKQLHLCLTNKQKQFLKICLHQKEKVASPPLNLKQWDGDCRQLHQLIHRRGLIRLSKALCGQHPDLIWHIVHVLDSGRGKVLNHYFSPAPIPGVTPALIQQTLNVINFLNLKRSL